MDEPERLLFDVYVLDKLIAAFEERGLAIDDPAVEAAFHVREQKQAKLEALGHAVR